MDRRPRTWSFRLLRLMDGDGGIHCRRSQRNDDLFQMKVLLVKDCRRRKLYFHWCWCRNGRCMMVPS